MRNAALAAIRAVDRRIAGASLALKREKPGLISFAVHALFADAEEARAAAVAPVHRLLVRDLAAMIEYFLALAYRFVTPAEIAAGLDPLGHHVWLTFDDGYANNLRALPLLEKHAVPATFFVSTSHVEAGKAFWWNAVYRERRRRGASDAAIETERQALKLRPDREIEAYVRRELGAAALDPAGDLDRPMSPGELEALAAAPLASLGNHTVDHAVLTRCDDAELRAQIRCCQEYLGARANTVPLAIAYPSGFFDDRVVRAARDEGLRVGATTARGKNRLPLGDDDAMRIRRYCLVPEPALREDFVLSRSDLGIVHLLRRFADG